MGYVPILSSLFHNAMLYTCDIIAGSLFQKSILMLGQSSSQSKLLIWNLWLEDFPHKRLKFNYMALLSKKNYKILLLFLAFYFFHCSFFLFFIALYDIFSFLNHSLLLFDQTFVVILFISLWSRIYNLDVFFPAFIIIG